MVLRRQTFAGHTLAVVVVPRRGRGDPGRPAAPALGYFGFCVGAGAGHRRGRRGRSAAGPGAASRPSSGLSRRFALACGFLFVSLYDGFLNGLDRAAVRHIPRHHGQPGAGPAHRWRPRALAVLALIARPLLLRLASTPTSPRRRGVPVRLLGAVFLVLLGCAAAEASQITGALLVFALLVMPAADGAADHGPAGGSASRSRSDSGSSPSGSAWRSRTSRSIRSASSSRPSASLGTSWRGPGVHFCGPDAGPLRGYRA